MDDFISEITEAELKREKAKARELRNSDWWKRKRGLGKCHYCGGAFKPDELTMDHIVPVIRGGKSVKGNVAPCCKDCNTQKKYLLPTEWNEYLDGLNNDEEQ